MTLPAKFVERVLRDLGGTEGAALCAALDAEPPVSVRLNPAKTGADTLPAGPDAGLPVPEAAGLPALAIAGRVPWSRDGRYLAVRPSFTLDPDFHAGAYYVQEASSQFVGHLLAAVRTEGARILDLCAAPGGKTTLYASLAGPDGLVVANEIDRRRASVLADNVRKWGTGNVAVTTCEPRALGDFEAWFDVVAVDAPCSGEGMFRKDPDARGEWSEGNVKQCAARQDEILREAWRALRPGGTLVYSTCTFNRDEDEGALERMAAWAGDEIAESEETAVEDAWGIVCGRVGAFRTFRFYPHRTCGEGFFAAVARKSFDAGGRARAEGASHGICGRGPEDRRRTGPLGAESRRYALRSGGRHLLCMVRRAGRRRADALRGVARDLFGRGAGAGVQGSAETRSRAGFFRRAEPRGAACGGTGRRRDAALPAPAGHRCRRAGRGDEPRLLAGACAGIRQTDRRTGE